MNISEFHPAIQTAQPALALISLARLPDGAARQNLRALLLANPNFFGRITGSSFKAVLGIQEDTTYERLSCIGYNPQLELVEAAITLNQNTGYSSAVRENGSVEFVRFYVSYDGGFSWRDQGLHFVKVADSDGSKRREHLVAAEIGPARTFCFMRRMPRVRAILSWNAAPPADTPDWLPVWGNVLEEQIQIREFALSPFDTVTAPLLIQELTGGSAA